MQVQKPLGNFDVSVMTLADRRLQPFIASELDERSPKFSPDGRWVAYMANESGSYDVFVRSFPGGEQKYRISTQGGARPLWGRDGRELFFLGLDGKLMATSVKPGATFEFAPPQALFQTPVDTGALLSSFPYAVVPDGQRFLFVVPVQETSTSVSLVLNWTAGLKK